MTGTSRCLLFCFVAACGTGDTRVDPADLELRDLLGMSPEVAGHWDADQRASARKLLVAGLHEEAPPVTVELAGGATVDARVAQTLAVLDAQRIQHGGAALGMVRVALDTRTLTAAPAPMASSAVGGAPVPQREIWLAEQWDQQGLTHLAGRGLDLMSGLAIDAGHASGPIVVVPVAHLAVIAGYVPGQPARLVINPVLLAALEPNDVSVETGGGGAATQTQTAAAIKSGPAIVVPQVAPHQSKAVGGNPYSFYGSYEECAAAESDRCQACLPNSDCKAVTDTSDGNAECTMLGANNGKGYYEICIDLALAISSVNNCVADKAPSCARSATAADHLSSLAANDDFLTDSSCSDALDNCLADIYGAPKGSFPSPIGVDGGVVPPSTDPPRDVSPSCGHGCSNNTSASPSCDCKGGNCGNSLTCSSACAASNDQSGCGGDASGCDSTDDSGSGGGSCDDSTSSSSSGSGSCDGGSNDNNTGSCSSDNSGDSCGGSSSSSSSGSSCDNSCGSSSSGSSSGCGSSGDSCGSSSSSSGCGSSSGGDSCGGSSGSSGCSGSSGGGSGCSAAKKEPSAILAVVVSAGWGLMPVPIAAFVKRRAKKKKKTAADEEVAS